MNATTSLLTTPTLPDHTQLPDSDGTFVENFQEHPQSMLLTTSIWPVLQRMHPDEQFCIGQDSGIYWRITDPPERGAIAPDWFYVPYVPPTLDGQIRRSYVLWQEHLAPAIVLEFASGDGSKERDRTPWKGKFWIYEQVIRPAFYGIYEVQKAQVELYHLIEGHYEQVPANERGHYPIPFLAVELGIWQGRYANVELPWLRWWDSQGNLLLTGDERVEQERKERESAQQQVEHMRHRLEQLEAQLRALGVEPKE